ncbi:thioesterase family protein [Flavobacteriaceae bacterium F08102]|nr:thioesterase family protein [Flavobacteriaceae bacterium F08102]
MVFEKRFTTKWADFDANRHMRHTAYNDYAAECRVRYFKESNLDVLNFEKLHFGPILFKEETTFFREVGLSQDLIVNVKLQAISPKGERFKMVHQIFREDGVLAAEVKIYAAWLNLETRKLMTPPQVAFDSLNALERTDDFEEIQLKKTP